MRYLLDTNVWLWMINEPHRLGRRTTKLLELEGNDLLLSSVSSAEIAIKFQLGRLPLPESPESYIPTVMERLGVRGLPIEHKHALRTSRLDRHHGDPFDRLLIAQAQVEEVPIITSDPIFERYPIKVILAG